MNEISGHAGPSSASRVQRRTARFATLRRRATAALCAVSLLLQHACYNSVPVTGAPAVSKGPVKILINERGRLLVGGQLGSLIDNVTGRIVSSDSVNVVVAVELAEDVRGKIARWGGERFTIPREGIESMTEKKVSRWRTVALLGGVALLIIGVVLGVNNSAFSGNDGGLPGPDPL